MHTTVAILLLWKLCSLDWVMLLKICKTDCYVLFCLPVRLCVQFGHVSVNSSSCSECSTWQYSSLICLTQWPVFDFSEWTSVCVAICLLLVCYQRFWTNSWCDSAQKTLKHNENKDFLQLLRYGMFLAVIWKVIDGWQRSFQFYSLSWFLCKKRIETSYGWSKCNVILCLFVQSVCLGGGGGVWVGVKPEQSLEFVKDSHVNENRKSRKNIMSVENKSTNILFFFYEN